MTGVIISPDLMGQLKPVHFPDTCTVQESTPSQSATGETTYAWSNLASHISLDCRVMTRGANERRELWATYAEAEKLVMLAGSYTSITSDHRLVYNSQNYDILGVIHDSEGMATYLAVRIARDQ